ncbi:MAG: hypothetical protein J2P41_08200 [Blastocatellia bacterium]|nr:hypothetical protein [Blastocatellia bacterium]
MRDVLQYFDLIAKVIELSPAVSADLELEHIDHKRGIIDGTLYFADGSRLEFTERIWIERARPVKRDYRYQYVHAQTSIFRYDNAPHHPQLSGFPHHKHIGRKTVTASEPSLEQVLQEVSEIISATPDMPLTEPRRRRRSGTKNDPR